MAKPCKDCDYSGYYPVACSKCLARTGTYLTREGKFLVAFVVVVVLALLVG